MKIAFLLVALIAMILSGCEQNADTEPNETDASFDKDLGTLVNQIASGGYTIRHSEHPTMLTDVANAKLLYANYRSSQKLQTTIDEFNRSSTALANKMLYLTILIAVLTLVTALLTAVQVANPIRRLLLWIRKMIRSLTHSYMQRFAKTQPAIASPVKQPEHSGESKDLSEKTATQDPEAH